LAGAGLEPCEHPHNLQTLVRLVTAGFGVGFWVVGGTNRVTWAASCSHEMARECVWCVAAKFSQGEVGVLTGRGMVPRDWSFCGCTADRVSHFLVTHQALCGCTADSVYLLVEQPVWLLLCLSNGSVDTSADVPHCTPCHSGCVARASHGEQALELFGPHFLVHLNSSRLACASGAVPLGRCHEVCAGRKHLRQV
jgi:hypothetical protein